MSEKEPKVKILYKKGRTLRLRFDYGKEISVTFPTDRTEEDIKEEIKQLYKKYKEKPRPIEIEKLDWDE